MHDDQLAGVDDDFGFALRRVSTNHRAGVDALVDATVGEVVLERLIGEGGMGRVYEGRQLRPKRDVAVKVLRPGMHSVASLRRFEREAQVLARLHHPGIAQIHSFGTHPVEGVETPYFVMEYVAGARPITEHAEAHGLTVHERLELFLRVCDAVGHAHARGILHRDLKPGNILVGEDGRPRVIDFGVARQLDRDTILTTVHEDIGNLMGTLPYMAPEQFGADAAGIDARADVYALGVVLYELLAGRLPFDLRHAVLAQAARIVLDEEAPPLMSFNRDAGRAISHVAQKCLAKDPQRRYASASALAEDIGSYLAGEPVSARAPAVADRIRRWRRRHGPLVAFGSGVLLTATTFLGLAVWRGTFEDVRGSTMGSAAVPAAVPSPRPWRALSADEAAELQPEDGMLSVNADTMTPEAARLLAAHDAHLSITLGSIDVEVARALASHPDGLAVGGVSELTDDVAAALAGGVGGSLNLDGVERLSRTACESLAGYEGWLNMNGVQQWPAGGLEAIVGHEGGLSIGLAGINAEQAGILARHRGPLFVVGVEVIDEAAARALIRHEGPLTLHRARGISPAAAELLRQRDDIEFPGK